MPDERPPKPSSSLDPSLPGRKPSRSGADTPKSTGMIQHGGKVDPRALRARLENAGTPDLVGAGAGEQGDAEGPIIETGDTDQVRSPSVDDDAPNRVVFVLQRNLDKRLDKYLCDRITFMSRTQLQRLIDEGGVTVNGRAPKASTKLGAGDRVEVYVPPPPPTDVIPQDIPLNVLYEDEHLIVLNKTPDIIVHPARGDKSGTIINALAFHFQNRSNVGGGLSGVGKDFARPGVVHRLDRHTSGLILFAKSDEAHWRLGQQFEQRTVDKRYLALVHGVFEPTIDVIDLPLGPHQSKEKGYREKYVVRHDHLGKQSLTIARVRQTFVRDRDIAIASDQVSSVPQAAPGVAPGWKPALGSNRAAAEPGGPRRDVPAFTLMELELKTGRTHQIRVHLSHRGFPIVGDDMYGGRAIYADPAAHVSLTPPVKLEPNQPVPPELVLINRQALHAATLRFRHPADGRVMSFTAPLPADMLGALRALRRMDETSLPIDPPGATIALGALES